MNTSIGARTLLIFSILLCLSVFADCTESVGIEPIDTTAFRYLTFEIDSIEVVDDGNLFPLIGKFYYTMYLDDDKGTVLNDQSGKSCTVNRSRQDADWTADHSKIDLRLVYMNVRLPKIAGESVVLHVVLWDRFNSVHDVIAGEVHLKWRYPVAKVTTIENALMFNSSSYKCYLHFKLKQF